MKRFYLTIVFFVFLLTCLTFSGCKKQFSLCDYITEQRIDIGYGESENYQLKCYYGFSTSENKKIYYLNFILTNITDDTISHNIKFNLNEKNYQGVFSFSPTYNAITYHSEIDALEKVFPLSVNITKASIAENIEISSIVPATIKPCKDALSSLYAQQQTFIDSFFVDNIFYGSLTVRVCVKDEKGYYYVGLTDTNNKLKAMLIDGDSLELLAIREVF